LARKISRDGGVSIEMLAERLLVSLWGVKERLRFTGIRVGLVNVCVGRDVGCAVGGDVSGLKRGGGGQECWSIGGSIGVVVVVQWRRRCSQRKTHSCADSMLAEKKKNRRFVAIMKLAYSMLQLSRNMRLTKSPPLVKRCIEKTRESARSLAPCMPMRRLCQERDYRASQRAQQFFKGFMRRQRTALFSSQGSTNRRNEDVEQSEEQMQATKMPSSLCGSDAAYAS
jgi:hypothetical protein